MDRVAALLRETFSKVVNSGDFCYAYDHNGIVAGLMYRCPCGCGMPGSIVFGETQPRGDNDEGQSRWHWDGNLEHPTLIPSIKRRTPCRWHGTLTAGVWTKE
jgi:hypothetical protein